MRVVGGRVERRAGREGGKRGRYDEGGEEGRKWGKRMGEMTEVEMRGRDEGGKRKGRGNKRRKEEEGRKGEVTR